MGNLNTKLHATILLIIFCNIFTIQAQYTVTGIIQNSKQEKLSNTTIRLFCNDSTFLKGTVSDSLGSFMFSNIDSGKYLLIIDHIGYTSANTTFSIHNSNHTIPSITLLDNNIELVGVEIKAQSFIRKEDHVLIIPDKKQIKHANTGYDLLNNLMIPGLDVDRRNGKVSTLGGNATLYIDGRKADYREIQSLRPKDIEKIEYYDNPTGKYANDVVSINYLTKKYKTGGYISLDGMQNIGYLKGDYNIVAKADHKNTNYIFYGGANVDKHNNTYNKKEKFLFPNYSINRLSEINTHQIEKNTQYAQLNIQNQNEKRTLMGKISFVRNNEPNNNEIGYLKYTGHYEKEQTLQNETKQTGLMPKLNIYGSFNLDKTQQLEINITGSYTKNNYTRTYTENEFTSCTDVKEKFYNLDANINYTYKLKHRNSLTSQLYHFHKVSSSTYTGDNDYWQHLWTAETLLFLEYNQQINNKVNFRFGPGFSSLQYRLHGNDYVGRISPRMRARLSYQPKPNQQLMIGINIGNSFPNISTINNIDQVIDMFQVKRGNPNMKNAQLYMPQIMYNIQHKSFNIQAMCYYLNVNNAVINDYYIENEKLIHSFNSDGNYHNLLSMLALSWKANDNLRFSANCIWNHTRITGAVSKSCNNLKGSLQANYYWKNFAINIYGETPQKQVDMSSIYVHLYGKYGASISWHYRNWGIEGGVDTPFTKHNRIKTELNTSVYNFTDYSYSQTFQKTGYLKLIYTFDFGRKTSHKKESINTSTNSAIMKVK